MELRVLGYFLAVAREENFTRAAEQLHVTQPTLSRQIADLETELGVKLFTRKNHSIVLTEDGMLLKHRAQEILSLVDRTKRDFLYKKEALQGTITIGSGEFLSTGILTDCIAAFRKKYPLVRYEFYSGNAVNLKDNIERGLLDVGLMMEPVDIRKYEFLCPSKRNGAHWCGRILCLQKKIGLHRKIWLGFRWLLPPVILRRTHLGNGSARREKRWTSSQQKTCCIMGPCLHKVISVQRLVFG